MNNEIKFSREELKQASLLLSSAAKHLTQNATQSATGNLDANDWLAIRILDACSEMVAVEAEL